MEWWSDLWLNEGFASYVEYLGVNASEPEWNIVCKSKYVFLLVSILYVVGSYNSGSCFDQVR